MERESNPMQALCRSGCGFYGSPATDGLCSLCFKENLKKKQQPPVSATSVSSSAQNNSSANNAGSLQSAFGNSSPATQGTTAQQSTIPSITQPTTDLTSPKDVSILKNFVIISGKPHFIRFILVGQTSKHNYKYFLEDVLTLPVVITFFKAIF